MFIRLYLLRKMLLARKRRELAKKEEFAAMLDDQINSGRHALYKVNQEIDALKAEIFSYEEPDVILRRVGAV